MTGLTESGTAVRQSLSSRHQAAASDSPGSVDKRDCHTRHPAPYRSRPAGQKPPKHRKPSLRTTARPRRLLLGYADTRHTCRQADGRCPPPRRTVLIRRRPVVGVRVGWASADLAVVAVSDRRGDRHLGETVSVEVRLRRRAATTTDPGRTGRWSGPGRPAAAVRIAPVSARRDVRFMPESSPQSRDRRHPHPGMAAGPGSLHPLYDRSSKPAGLARTRGRPGMRAPGMMVGRRSLHMVPAPRAPRSRSLPGRDFPPLCERLLVVLTPPVMSIPRSTGGVNPLKELPP
ncbi:hypothetical protein HDA35_001643 [Micromonospora purpureochromogenes]|uniref:Uncharacterized protein n=1 Tax=Micromonospora purpureochromogenes TaxID=47872 RepID=A0ABX2RK61_9ACTN|nr:hypothetical protein [Micromonospora purpureochromogenes]